MFDCILNNNEEVSSIVNKASEENCELSSKQSIIMLQRILYLQNAFFNILISDLDEPFSFKLCCKKAIKQMNEIGIKLVKNARTLMQWNRVFRHQEVFPHPNYYVEMGKTDKPIFLQTFPQVKFELSNWATKNLNNLNCETVGNELRQKIIPEIYKSYHVDANEELSLN